MNRKYANLTNIPLSVAVYLATDYYDYEPKEKQISATELLKSVRQIVLAKRVPHDQFVVDIGSLIPSRMGTSVHDGIENAWLTNYKDAMRSLGYTDDIISRIRVNPVESLKTGEIPVYMEKREFKQVGRWTVAGKYDFVFNGMLEDFKTTSTFTVTKGNRIKEHALQGSIYKWLNPDIITEPNMHVQYILTDWSAMRAKTDPTYPQTRIVTKTVELMQPTAVEHFIKTKLALVDKYMDAPEEDIPFCTDEELWRDEPVFRYYKNPENTGRSTKNFDNYQDALVRLNKDGNVGVIRTQPGQARACLYCPAFPVCSQKDLLIAAGELII